MAAEHQLDVAAIQGTGPGGRIIREDIEAALDRQQVATSVEPVPAAVPPAAARAVPLVPDDDVAIVPLSQMRKTIAKRLQQSMQTVPHFYMTVSIDTTRLSELRASLNEYAMALPQPVKITLNDLIIRATALALLRIPEVNASFDGERLLVKKRIHIGVAVALDRGLIVPVIRDADKRTVLDIARESRRLVDAARANTLKPEDIQGGTFSLSNPGMYGIESFTAVINPPESAILAVGAVAPTPVVVDGQVVVREMMKVTLSSDHRVLDGAVSARFVQEIKQLIEQPMSLLM
jgi:pyruvate dehydrogenase E2 component (dihydrolipoamide acetyltransferase)